MTTAKSAKSAKSNGAASGKAKKESTTMIENKLKDQFEKTVNFFGDFTTFGKDNVEAFIEFANATSKGVETLQSEAIAYSKQAVEEGVETAKSAMTARSIQELVEIQSTYTKNAIEGYMAQMNKMNDLVSGVAREASGPLTGRWNAFVEMMQSARA